MTKIISIGDKFGKLLVLREVEPIFYGKQKKKEKRFECQCECGNIKITSKPVLFNSKNISCGCDRGDRVRDYKDVVGLKSGRLTIIREVESTYRTDEKSKNKKMKLRFVECQCECGNISPRVRLDGFIVGRVKSCGCIVKEGNPNSINKLNKIEYNTWTRIKGRCFNIRNKRYKDYGGRGITICDRWKDSFENFLDDMGKRPKGRYSIERIDNNGNYEPSNCKWATNKEQSTNKRTTVYINKGDKFGELTVLEEVDSIVDNFHTIRMIKCVCDCGSINTYRINNLKSGKSKTCGHHRFQNLKQYKKASN